MKRKNNEKGKIDNISWANGWVEGAIFVMLGILALKFILKIKENIIIEARTLAIILGIIIYCIMVIMLIRFSKRIINK